MRDFNKTIHMDRFELGNVTVDGLGGKIYEKGIESIKELMSTGGDVKKLKILDLNCSQSFVREFMSSDFDYAGLDSQLNFERYGKKIVPEIQSDINNIPLKDNTVDIMFAVGQKLAYGEYHQSVFEIERVIKQNGHLVVALTRYWFHKGFNQLLFCYRGWKYIKAVEVNYKLTDGDSSKETSKYFAVYKYVK